MFCLILNELIVRSKNFVGEMFSLKLIGSVETMQITQAIRSVVLIN